MDRTRVQIIVAILRIVEMKPAESPRVFKHITLEKGDLHFQATLELDQPLDAGSLKEQVRFDNVSGDLHIPLPDGTVFDVGFQDVAWDMHGLPTGKIGLKEDLVINFAGEPPDDCFQLVLPAQR